MYEATCPACSKGHSFTEADVGVAVSCGRCGCAFVLGEEIVAEHKIREGLLRDAEQLAAMGDALGGERSRGRRIGLAEAEYAGVAERAHPFLVRCAPPLDPNPVLVDSGLSLLLGVLGVFGAGLSDVWFVAVMIIRTSMDPPGLAAPIIIFWSSLVLWAAGRSIALLSSIERNTAGAGRRGRSEKAEAVAEVRR